MGSGSAASDEIDLSPGERADIDGMYLRLASGNLYEVLGVARSSDRKAVRDAYFALSQRFHPDAYFGRNLGGYKARTEEIFREVTRAYEVLSHKAKRAEYDATLPPDTSTPAPAPAATPAAPAPAPAPAPARPAPASGAVAVAPQPAPARPAAPQPAPAAPAPPPPTMSQEAALRAAREALARRLGASGSRSMPAVNARAAAAPVATAETTAASLENLRRQKIVSDHVAKVDALRKTVDDAEARGDWVAASNGMQVLLGMTNDDASKLRAEQLARRAAAVQADQYLADGRAYERNGEPLKAIPAYLKALNGRPDDPAIMVRAATVLFATNRELPRAAELARRATQLAPQNAEAFTVLARIFLAGGLKASAVSALEAAAKLDPTSPAVKDLQAKLK